jgi:hypothetical protein
MVNRRPRNKRDIPIEHRDIPISGDERRRIKEAFEQREAARGRGTAKSADEQERKAPSRPVDRDVRRFLDKGYSEELAQEMAQAMVPHDVRSRWGGDQL